MRILIDIGHPAHVHLFAHFALEMSQKGHRVLFTCRDKEFEISLLKRYGFEYTSFGKKFNSTLGKIFGMFKFDLQEIKSALRFKADIFLSHGSMYAAHAAFLLRKPHISFEDTFNFEQVRLYQLFTSAILTGAYDHPLKSRKVVRYSGYHELAYLHPNIFTPDRQVLTDLGMKEGEKYIIIRFVAWNASHDTGHKGINYENKMKAVNEFSKLAKVFISSESPLPPELELYRFPLPPQRMHHAIAFASLIFGESATMASEAAVLGIPAIYLDNTGRLYTKEQQEKYGLVFNYTESEEDQQKAITKGMELLTMPNIKEEWQEKRQKMVAEKIDVTAFLVWFIENYPQSIQVMKENPDCQYKFI
jgi:uncharacterized protein